MIAHAVAREPLFCDDLDRKRYLGLLQRAAEVYRWKVLTFVLLDNHVHLLVIAAARDLSGALWWMHWQYAESFHARHPPRRGHVFESRPKTLPIQDERYLLAVLRYIANNPVEAGAALDPSAYRWSAHRAILGVSPPMPVISTSEVLRRFAPDDASARAAYDEFVRGPDTADDDCVRLWAEGPPADRPSLTELLAADASASALRSAHVRWGYTIRAIAAAIDVSPATVSRRIGGGSR